MTQDLKTILVPYDFSEMSNKALEMAICLALHYRAMIKVLYVMEHTPHDELLKLLVLPEDFQTRLRHKVHASIHGRVPADLRSQIRTEILIGQGKAAIEILLVAQKEKADLIVLGTHGRSGLKRLLMGSVAERIVQRSAIPVFVQRGEKNSLPQKILLPIDFSDYSREGFEAGLRWAAEWKAFVHLLHVVNLQDLYTFDVLSIPADRPSLEKALKDQAEAKLAEWGKGLSLPHQLEVRLGDPSFEIQEAILSHGIDLVILATHGRSGLKHILMGSVAEKVMRYSPCPVLTVRPGAIAQSITPIFESEKSLDDYVKSFRS